MEKKDFFVSYNKANKDWAKWIAGTLEENSYTVYLQAWDITPGDDFIKRMNDFLEHSDKYIPVLSTAFWGSEYCKKEFQTAFNAHLNNDIRLIPIRVEDISLDALYNTTVYIDLFDIEESKATDLLLNGVGHTVNPRNKGRFPGSAITVMDKNSTAEVTHKPSFPGLTSNNLPDRNSCFIGHKKIRDIIILETAKNKKGDLFNRLVYDVFHALGFGEPRYDIPKPGREIDMVLQHRTENRFALVESKALQVKVGGADINKFAGAFDVERGMYERDGNSVVGYFIARSGFKATALEQEDERAETRKGRNEKSEIVLLGPKEIARELIQGNVLCSLEKAADAVRQPSGDALALCENVDLIACEQGWIWVLYYARLPRQTTTHFAFIHADGNQLLNSIADVLLNQTRSKNFAFSGLTYISAASDTTLDKEVAQDAYFKYLENELGEIQFEGMPTDKEAGTVKVNLENIFVPLRFNYKEPIKGEDDIEFQISQTSIKGVLSRTSRAAILAKPGGGKSTLIRRIALAYSYPERRTKVDDGLPDCKWFPVYIRCRDLGDDAAKSIMEIIGTIVYRAEITKHKHSFEALVEDTLQDGRVLLLIDGLDEISNEKNRICFVNQLRTFVATYPTVRLIITSREAGFRAVAGTLASYCEQYSIANLNKEEIRNLSLKWHQAIFGESDKTETDSNKVCDIILNDRRIIALAENPLLLTTLLFVKRWVGYLPPKKCRLYEEMIKLLLVTWNAAAHDKLDMDETEPQLAFVAYYMTTQGQQKITRDTLDKCIIEARKALPELLSYTTVSPSRFIDQVEERSSLLIQLGLEENDKGLWVPSYEFSHLSFQEYLTAKAIAESWTPDSDDRYLLDVLKPYINKDHWKEVIPLAAVLSGRQAKPLVEYLVELSAKKKPSKDDTFSSKHFSPEDIAPLHLANCIASEVPMSQELLEKAIILVVERKRTIDMINKLFESPEFPASINIFDTIIKSKYGSNYQETVKNTIFYKLEYEYAFEFLDAWIEVYYSANGNATPYNILQMLKSNNYENQVTAALLMMQCAFDNKYSRILLSAPKNLDITIMSDIFSFIFKMLLTDDTLSIYSAAWCIAWSGYDNADIIPYEILPSVVKRLVDLWLSISLPYELRRVISWGLYSVCMPELHKDVFQDVLGLAEAIEDNCLNPRNEFDELTAIQLAVLTNYWTKEEARNRLSLFDKKNYQRKKEYSRFLEESGFHTRD